MEKSAFCRMWGMLALVVLVTLSAGLSAAPVKDPVVGNWHVEVDFNGRQMASIIALSRNQAGELGGQWISGWGVTKLDDVKYEGKKLSFSQVNRFGDREWTSNFAGTIDRWKLSGTLSSDRGQWTAQGRRMRAMPNAVGRWEAKIKVGERQYPATLIVKAGQKGRLTAQWESQWGEHEITDLAFKKGKLTFKRHSKAQDRQWESTFEGTVKNQVLSGTFESDRGTSSLEAKRLGAALIGTWNLKVTSDSGNRVQRLKVNPDLSALYGSIAIDKVELEGNQVRFATALEFGDQRFDMSFAGTLTGRKLTGELTSPRGTRQVDGVKRGRKPPQGPTRKPDVVFVPTPPEVVEKMLELAKVTKDDLVYDLGCGDGRIVVTAAQKYGCRGVGYDISRKRVQESLKNVRDHNVGHLVTIEHQDIFTLDLSKANVITLYLLPSLNVKLIPQLEKLKPGSRIVSHDFDMKGVKPDQVVTITSDNSYEEHTIYLWTAPLKHTNAKPK